MNLLKLSSFVSMKRTLLNFFLVGLCEFRSQGVRASGAVHAVHGFRKDVSCVQGRFQTSHTANLKI